jgi:hypothetical protein
MRALESGRFLVLGAALAVGAWAFRRAPADQMVHYVLGDAAPHVEELDVRWQEDTSTRSNDEWLREVTFRFAPGAAPRIVTHEPRLRNGDYAVEIEVVMTSSEQPRTLVRRRVQLTGGALSINVGSSVPKE